MSSVLKVDNIEKYYGSKSRSYKEKRSIVSVLKWKRSILELWGSFRRWEDDIIRLFSTIDQVTAGNIMINGMDITKLKGKHLSRFRPERN